MRRWLAWGCDAPAACGKQDAGCVETDRARAKAARSGLMVPWGWEPSSKGVGQAADELRRALQAEGGYDVKAATLLRACWACCAKTTR